MFVRVLAALLHAANRVVSGVRDDTTVGTVKTMSRYLHLAPSQLALAGTQAEVERGPIRVLLADDHARVRRNLRRVLDSEDGIEVVVEAADISTVLRHVARHHPHVIVLDLQLAGGSSIDAIRRLRELVPDTELVVLTMERSAAFTQGALAAGAVALVLKDRADTELAPAVRCASRGEEFVSPLMAAGLNALRRCIDGDGLSQRETEVLRLTALGHTSIEIAPLLHLSRRTVEAHRASVHRKLGTRTRAELVQFALARHLIGS